MKLFFETSLQAYTFLTAIPLGIVLAVCFDLASVARATRPVWDILIMLLCGVAVILFLLWTKDEGLRFYHLLSLLIGTLLYTCGMGALLRALGRRLQQIKSNGKNLKNSG